MLSQLTLPYQQLGLLRRSPRGNSEGLGRQGGDTGYQEGSALTTAFLHFLGWNSFQVLFRGGPWGGQCCDPIARANLLLLQVAPEPPQAEHFSCAPSLPPCPHRLAISSVLRLQWRLWLPGEATGPGSCTRRRQGYRALLASTPGGLDT